MDFRSLAKHDIKIVATLLEKISQKLPYASESVLQEVWMILGSATNCQEPLDLENEVLYDEFDRWEAASDEDGDRLEEMLVSENLKNG
jgi:hypothetical protein